MWCYDKLQVLVLLLSHSLPNNYLQAELPFASERRHQWDEVSIVDDWWAARKWKNIGGDLDSKIMPLLWNAPHLYYEEVRCGSDMVSRIRFYYQIVVFFLFGRKWHKYKQNNQVRRWGWVLLKTWCACIVIKNRIVGILYHFLWFHVKNGRSLLARCFCNDVSGRSRTRSYPLNHSIGC